MIGIIVAMSNEFSLVLENMAYVNEMSFHGIDFVHGYLFGEEVVLHKCGIGKVNSAIGTFAMLSKFPSVKLVVSTGVAGSLNREIGQGDVVCGSAYAYHDVYCGGNSLRGQIQGDELYYKNTSGIDVSDICNVGLIVTGDQFIDNVYKAYDISKLYPQAIAVDMESCSIARACEKLSVPFMSVRVISDCVCSRNSAKSYDDFWVNATKKNFSFLKKVIEKYGNKKD